MLWREITEELENWYKEPQKKALLITGARQVGKSFIVREFAKRHYQQFVELNFLLDPDAIRIFDGNLSADAITEGISAYTMQKLIPGETLIFLDEIQECPNARTAIKFLVQDGRFDYIESGSLLGVKYKEVKSYPVGFERRVQMFPLTFFEFCVANGMPDNVLENIRRAFTEKQPVSESVHMRMTELFRIYMIVGGMPEVVQRYVDTHDIAQVVENQKEICEAYRQDVSKYASEKEKSKAVFDLIPSELNDRNRRFYFTDIDKNARVSRYENAVNWLVDAGVALPCYNVTEPTIPLELNQQSNYMRLYMSDVGLLCASSMENVQFQILQGNVDVNMGSVMENVFAQMFAAAGYKLRYLQKKKMELDFVLQDDQDVMVVEIKSGKDFKKHPSLTKALETENWNVKRAIVFCEGNVEQDGDILYLPWYMAMFFSAQKIHGPMIVNFEWNV